MPMFWKPTKKGVIRLFNRQRGPRKNKNYRKEEAIPIDPGLMSRLKSQADTARETVARQHALSTHVVLLPDGGYRAIWDCICIVALGYTFLEIPYALVFLDTSCLWEARDIINLVCDCVFLFDVLLNFNTAYYDENLVLMDDHKSIAIRYVTTWFVMDLVSSMPMERIVCSGGTEQSGNQAYLRFFKILRLVKMLRLLRFLRVIKKWEMLSGSGFVSRAIRLFKFANFLIFCAHICGCFWMLMVSEECLIPDDERPDFSTTCGCEGPDCYRWNWLERYDPDLAANGTPESKYLASLYFSIVTLSTVGFGDITPTNDAERMYSIFLALTGAVVFAFCIGSISSLATEGNKTETMIEERIKEITDFLRYRRLPRTIEAKVRKDLFHASAKAPHLFHPCLDILPRYIRTEVRSELSVTDGMRGGADTGKIPMFSNMDSDCRAHITALLRPISLNAQEYLFRALDSADEMYFVTSGVLEEWDLEGSRIISKCSVGDIVGEMNMFVDPEIPVRLSSVRSRTKSELLVLSRTDFLKEIKPHFPDVYLSIRDLALEQLQYVDLDKVAVKMSERSIVRCSGFTHQRAHFIKMMEEVRKVHLLEPALVARAAYRHAANALSSMKTSNTGMTSQSGQGRSGWTAFPDLLSTRSHAGGSNFHASPALLPGARRRSLDPQPGVVISESSVLPNSLGERFFGERGTLVSEEDEGGMNVEHTDHRECAAVVETAVAALRDEMSHRLAGLEQSVHLMLRAMSAAHSSRNSFDVLALYGKPNPALRASEALASAAAEAQRQNWSPVSSAGPSSPRSRPAEQRDGARDDVHRRPSRGKDEVGMVPRSNSHGDLYVRSRATSLGLPKVDEKEDVKTPANANGNGNSVTANGERKTDKKEDVKGGEDVSEIEEAGGQPKPSTQIAHESKTATGGGVYSSAEVEAVAERASAGVTELFGVFDDMVSVRGGSGSGPAKGDSTSASPWAAVSTSSPPGNTQDGGANSKPVASPVVPASEPSGKNLVQNLLDYKNKEQLVKPSPPPAPRSEDAAPIVQPAVTAVRNVTPANRAMLPASPGQLPAIRKRNPFF